MMKILMVCSYKENLAEGCVPFIREQVEALRAQGCECAYYYINGKGVLGYLREIPGLRKKIREWKPDVVHAHYGLSCLVANIATRRVPVVSTYHGSDINEPKVLPFSKVAIWLSAWNIFVSKRNVDIANPKKRWSLIPCGVNLPQPWSELQKQKVEQLTLNQWIDGVLDPNKKHVLFAGAFDNAVKYPQLAMDAVASLNDKMSRLRLNEPHTLNEVQLIELKGYSRDQVNALMYNCGAFLMTSKTEGSPQVIKEAMACGCPIVSVDVGDVAERVADVDGCYVVPSEELREKREELIEELAKALKKAVAFEGRTKGRERIIEAGLTNELVAAQIVKIYEKVLGL